MPLQTGFWIAHAGGTSQLQISAVDSGGNVTAAFTGPGFSGTARGFWDEDSQRLLLLVNTAGGASTQFTGYLFTDTVNLTGVAGGSIFTLVGEFETFNSTFKPSAKRSTFGWYAQIGVE